MARAIAKCHCIGCGQQFERIAFKNNWTQAESWRKWAEENITECPECATKRKAIENAKKAVEVIAKYKIPTIKGVSEKQIKYANDLRNKYIAENEIEIKKCNKYLKIAVSDAYKTECAKKNVVPEDNLQKVLERHMLERAKIILTEDNASKIIDELN